MSDDNWKLFEAFLNQHDGDSWTRVINDLLPSIHEVDKNATLIWMAFFPIDLAVAIEAEPDRERLIEELQILGKYSLKEQIDSSHSFLYGHRYWPEVKKAITDQAKSTAASSPELGSQIREVAKRVSGTLKVPESLLVGITAAGFMTLQQVGLRAFGTEPGKVQIDPKHAKKTPEQVVRARSKNNSQGLFGFLRGDNKVWNITFNENVDGCVFKLIDTQELTSAAANDTRHYERRDPKLLGSVGPIPVQCRAASCGTCWVGVLGGADRLAAVDPLESKRIKKFGYIDTDERNPVIRLACRAQGKGAVTLVVPPWNGVFGKFLEDRKKAAAEETEKAGSV
ncbi:MAG: 2Fe-2S iron-sulfur cluster-binding protein [Blastocatellia bacterium]